ncbi:UDP-glycosyltransferase UGT5-like [Leptopilina heterotoma]|uniref:UDP-glycosyltransferase UGT5-like n=1 Tax=Leptopilina heterotoma TaxID=63436 RepID=UPI001CA86C1F|nr:UDP-glycosyltransferase UGT5-like [Leptopilina heterotoma]
MTFINYLIIVTTFFLITQVHTYKILGIFPLAFKSHNIFFQALIKSLAKKGHQVDIISYYEAKNPPDNYRDIINLSKLPNSSYFLSKSEFNSIQEAVEESGSIKKLLRDTYGLPTCKIISHERIQNFIKKIPENSPYDAVITEGLVAPCYYGFGFLLNVPIISASSNFEFTPLAKQVGNPPCMSFMPTALLPKFHLKTFWNRLRNSVLSFLIEILFFLISEKQSIIMQKYLNKNIPSVRQVERTVALSIINTHHSLRGVKPVTEAVIEIAGLHIEEDNSTLSKELMKWMDESVHGIVYISFGTALPLESLPKETLLSMFSSFAKLAPMRILIKVTKKNKLPPEIPENVLTMIWIPQIPILKHRNTRVFISHGGIHSVIEALYFGIPVIGIPIVYDQDQNLRLLENKNMCIILDYDKITENSMDMAISKMLNDSSFRKAAQYHSKLFLDRPMNPGNEAVYWIEYVIRNGGESLRSPAVNMYWYQVELLDVYGFLFCCILLIICLILVTVKVILKKYKINTKTFIITDGLSSIAKSMLSIFLKFSPKLKFKSVLIFQSRQ